MIKVGIHLIYRISTFLLDILISRVVVNGAVSEFLVEPYYMEVLRELGEIKHKKGYLQS